MTALWLEMLAASDAALQDPNSATTDDGAIAAAHINAIADFIARAGLANYPADQISENMQLIHGIVRMLKVEASIASEK